MENTVVKVDLIVEKNNFTAIKKSVEERLEKFNLVITLENEVEAVKERAAINKIKLEYDTERKNVNKSVNAAYKEIDEIVGKKLKAYDDALLKVEEERQAKQKAEIEAYYVTLKTDIPLDEIFDVRWLNKSIDWKGEIAKVLIERRAAETTVEVDEAVDFILGVDFAHGESQTVITVETTAITTLKLRNVKAEQLQEVTDLLRKLNVEFTVE